MDLLTVFNNFFSCQGMLKRTKILGDIPSNREAYANMYRVAWPAALESVLVMMVASVDTMMVGGLGSSAIAAVGLTNQPKAILLAAIWSLNFGVTAIVARRKGEGNKLAANRCLRQSILISGMMILILGTLGFFFAKPILHFIGAEPDVIDTSATYFRIIIIGLVPTSLSLTINAAQRGIGNTKISMRTNLSANLVNLVFNYLFIGGNLGFPRLEVAGAAIATVIGNFVAFFMSLYSIMHQDGFLSIRRRGRWMFDKKTVYGLLNVGGSAVAEQVFMRIGFLLFDKIVASLGTVAFATHQICIQILNLSFGFGDGLSAAAGSLVGQNLGAKRPDLSILYGKVAQRMAFIVSSVLFFLFAFAGKYIAMLFSDEQEVLNVAAVVMIFAAFVTHGQTSLVVISGALRGAGDAKFVAISSMICTAILRPILTYLAAYPFGLGLYGAWCAILVDQYLRLILNFRRFSRGKWTAIKL